MARQELDINCLRVIYSSLYIAGGEISQHLNFVLYILSPIVAITLLTDKKNHYI